MTDRTALVRDIESFRPELVAHCYRMSGSYEEAQDLVQETFLRAWRAADTFEGRASTRTWPHRITSHRIRTISVFAEPRLVEVFGYPPGIEDENRCGDE
jgi:RNA polymerase sigma-70 factor (ECF subfamily)